LEDDWQEFLNLLTKPLIRNKQRRPKFALFDEFFSHSVSLYPFAADRSGAGKLTKIHKFNRLPRNIQPSHRLCLGWGQGYSF
jgi:hypothetical protein